MNINIVVAVSENQVIGKDNQLLWHLPNDMKFFKNTTWGMPVIMGRKTYESLGKPLTGRTNIVVTTNTEWSAPGTISVNSLEAALTAAADTDAREVYVIGGGEIYRHALPVTHRVYLTRVHTQIEGDTFFPELPAAEWSLHSRLDFPMDEKHAFAYSFEVWDRIAK
ncbi:dihydrofolate reductase [Flavihumibacter stibioxidans]|uniref:Dihydrofolate reductase n=1 Tax=Flavihumibacter stibioxidans TaxID=1834163 RepID=A0ABR7MBP1_9BACT|nr:dihydrofolate reductase [Flavihumibacter stibioxidans]MBC6492453.1 diacylglycerol kinase [Flavihumibacter stibioxidans]